MQEDGLAQVVEPIRSAAYMPLSQSAFGNRIRERPFARPSLLQTTVYFKEKETDVPATVRHIPKSAP